MDPFHARLTRVGLSAAARFGFCLAGGYAIQEHGFVERHSEDVDLFTTLAAERDFPKAVQAVIDALQANGLEVAVPLERPAFARLSVTDPSGETGKLELGVDWRAHPPTVLSVGPVLHPDDAVANKVCALYGRGEVRDYIDVDGILRSGRYTLADVVELATGHDPGFDRSMFAQALAAVRRLPDSAFEPYGMDADAADALRRRVVGWGEEIAQQP